jgi:FKBP-type peptidyl-prolyl cis-trans isomerase FkpA
MPSAGLLIETLAEGLGHTPHSGDTVVVHYTGWLTNGQKFDSSIDRGQAFEFVIGRGQVIAGWDEGVGRTRAGERARLTIPPELDYGGQGASGRSGNHGGKARSMSQPRLVHGWIGPPWAGAGQMIPPQANLVCEVELLEVRGR